MQKPIMKKALIERNSHNEELIRREAMADQVFKLRERALRLEEPAIVEGLKNALGWAFSLLTNDELRETVINDYKEAHPSRPILCLVKGRK